MTDDRYKPDPPKGSEAYFAKYPWAREIEPVCTSSDVLGDCYEHPAFGMISVSRASGSAVLFGSDFIHNGYVSLEISGATLSRSLADDRIHGGHRSIISIEMSHAQWATFVSSFGTSGAPCTIRYADGEHKPRLPYREQRTHFEKEGHETIAKSAALLAELEAAMAGDLDKVPKKTRESLLDRVRLARRALDDSLPFVAKQFAEHMEETVEKAKVEVHSYIAAHIRQAGLAALGSPVSSAPLALEGPEKPEKEAEG